MEEKQQSFESFPQHKYFVTQIDKTTQTARF